MLLRFLLGMLHRKVFFTESDPCYQQIWLHSYSILYFTLFHYIFGLAVQNRLVVDDLGKDLGLFMMTVSEWSTRIVIITIWPWNSYHLVIAIDHTFAIHWIMVSLFPLILGRITLDCSTIRNTKRLTMIWLGVITLPRFIFYSLLHLVSSLKIELVLIWLRLCPKHSALFLWRSLVLIYHWWFVKADALFWLDANWDLITGSFLDIRSFWYSGFVQTFFKWSLSAGSSPMWFTYLFILHHRIDEKRLFN